MEECSQLLGSYRSLYDFDLGDTVQLGAWTESSTPKGVSLGFSFTRHPQPQQQSFERLTGIFSISDALAGKPCVASLLACRIQSSIKYFWVRHLLPEIPSFKVIRLSTGTSFTLGSKSMRDDADCSQTAG
uniref:Uncharacterized protein n=1 Tax=Coccidioides posadasii RMSCC 3488 TaxID=454284 RepID=A0A0J6FGX4_COCPO|nr:hypothetical protein CPAG_08691 [Coccidioides posadasii RMSCC 3488]